MEKWREELLMDAESELHRAMATTREAYEKALERIGKACLLKRRIICALRAKPESIFGDDCVFVRTGNHLLVHDVAKELGITLEREGESDGFNFKGELEGVRINVYGMQTVPHCKIVKKKVMKEVIEYLVICNEEVEQK